MSVEAVVSTPVVAVDSVPVVTLDDVVFVDPVVTADAELTVDSVAGVGEDSEEAGDTVDVLESVAGGGPYMISVAYEEATILVEVKVTVAARARATEVAMRMLSESFIIRVKYVVGLTL